MGDVRCMGCSAAVADSAGPVHPYMLSAPGCWALYCSLENWKATLPADNQAVTAIQHLVDSYAAQHPTNVDRRNRQSVAVHLMSLCASLEKDLPGDRLRYLLGGWTHREYPVLRAPPRNFSVTVCDVVDASEPERSAAVLDLAVATWSAWSTHHAGRSPRRGVRTGEPAAP